jgi:hypothetical protein
VPDVTLVTTVITTVGTLSGALGGIALTHWTGILRENRQALRQRADKRSDDQQFAYSAVLCGSAQLRAHVEITCQQHWPDLNVRLAAADEHAAALRLQAARSAILSGGPLASAGLAVGVAASGLVSWLTAHARLEREFSGPGEQFRRGVVDGTPDFGELDACTAEFLRLACAQLDGSPVS